MRVVTVCFLLFVLSSCTLFASDQASNSSDAPNGSFNGSDRQNGSERIMNGSRTDPVPVNTSDDANATLLSVNTTRSPIALNRSVLGYVDTDDERPRIMSFAIINPVTNLAVPGFENLTGTVRIEEDEIPPRIAIRANYAGEVRSVLFALNGDENFRVENAAPFALHGDDAGEFEPWRIDRGSYAITATPYARPDAIGSAHPPLSFELEVYPDQYLDRVPNP